MTADVKNYGLEPVVLKKPAKDKDGLFKKRGIWQYRLKIDGKWRQFSTGTTSYQEAKKVRQEALQAQTDGSLPTDTAKAKLSQVVPLWLEERKALKSEATWKTESFLVKPLLKAFGEKRLCDITAADLRRYQVARVKGVSASTVNRELRVLRTIFKVSKCWNRLADEYEQLRTSSKGPGRALSPEEEQRLFKTAELCDEWEVAYLAGIAASNTTARACELRALRLEDVDLAGEEIYIRKSKTDAGLRIIPLNSAAKWAFTKLVQRAQVLEAMEPLHYLFPSCQRRQIDVTQHQKTWRTAWRSLTKKAGLPGLRFHDLRHHAITRLAESGASEQTVMAIAGHVSREMLGHYSHIRQQAKREAVAAINTYDPSATETTEDVLIQ